MAPHDALLEHLNLKPKTKSYGKQLIRQVTHKTGPGKGYNVDKYHVGIPAVCMRIATEKLNNGDVSEAAAQAASCLTRTEYKKLYGIICTLVEDIEKAELEYDVLHEMYGTESLYASLKPFFTQVERELLRLDKGLEPKMEVFTGTVFFWVCGSAQVKTLPETMVYIHENDLPMKRFIELLQLLNENCGLLKKTIERHSKGKVPSPMKKSTTTTTSTPRQSPRKNTVVTAEEPKTPSKRQTRQSNPNLETLLGPSPIKRVNQLSPTKIAQPSPFRGALGKKVPIRELPSKDSPKKRAVTSEQNKDDGMDIDSLAITESPLKKRKMESPIKAIAQSSVATSSNTRKALVMPEVLVTPVKKKLMATTSPSVLRSSSREQVAAVESDSSSDESEPEMNPSMRRFRPVYLDFKQWNARDPRLDRIWKKAGKQCRALAASGPPGGSDKMDID